MRSVAARTDAGTPDPPCNVVAHAGAEQIAVGARAEPGALSSPDLVQPDSRSAATIAAGTAASCTAACAASGRTAGRSEQPLGDR